MIDINLVPVKLRKTKRKKASSNALNMPVEVIIGLGGGMIVLLIVTHIALFVININKLAQHKGLKKQWEEILPSKTNVDDVLKKLRSLQSKHKAIEELTQESYIAWSQYFNILSDSLPRDVWLRRIALDDGVFFIEGSALSRDNQEMINVHKFTTKLKGTPDFLKSLENIDLGSIQRRSIKKVEIADFLITTKIK